MVERRLGTDSALAVKPTARAAAGLGRLAGYAAKFDRETVIAGLFREVVAPGAFTRALPKSDVRALFNHDGNKLLGRTSSGTLTVKEDRIGLHYTVTLPDTRDARDVLTLVQRGDVTGSSFAFVIQDDLWEYPKKGLPLRRILAVADLIDVSAVTWPAYSASSVEANSRRDAMRGEQAAETGQRSADTGRAVKAIQALAEAKGCACCGGALISAEARVLGHQRTFEVVCRLCGDVAVLRHRRDAMRPAGPNAQTELRRRRLARAEKELHVNHGQ